MPSPRRIGAVSAALLGPLVLAYRFALVYRARAGYPRRRPAQFTPADLGLPFDSTVVDSPGGRLPAWFIPANCGRPGPGVVMVHGWESARDRALPYAQFLHAAGFHCLVFDVRGHGGNPAELLPISAGEFGADALAALDAMLQRPEVTSAALMGHSIGGAGAIIAAAADPRTAALIATAVPSDPDRLTRQTFRLAHLPFPGPVAWPLGWLTTRVFLRPRGHSIGAVSAREAIARVDGPILLIHGRQDQVVPFGDLARLATAAGRARRRSGSSAALEILVVDEGRHSWLHEDEGYRRTVARFLTEAMGGPFTPLEAAARAAAVDAQRLPEVQQPFAALREPPGRLRTIAELTGAVAASTPDTGLIGAGDR